MIDRTKTSVQATTLAEGLSEREAKARLTSEGPNELPRVQYRTPLRILLEVTREPMLALLLVGGLVYLALGSLEEALLLITFALLSIAITVVQESRTERVLEALRDLSSPRALVVRDGQMMRVAGREVVRGDVMLLTEGDRVPADARVIESRELQVDESLLTGESVPVRKASSTVAVLQNASRPGGDDLPFVFSGSLIVRGNGKAIVTATGARSELGRIGQSLSTMRIETPRLQSQVRRFVRIFGLGGAAISVFAAVLYGLTRGGWLDAVLAGISLAMSMLPEEFPVVLAVFLAMGAWRISRANVLTRRASAIESLGAATVLCTDKTGTLTQNLMSVAQLRLPEGEILDRTDDQARAIPPQFHHLLRIAVLASSKVPVDPMDKAFHALGHTLTFGQEGTVTPRLLRSFGITPQLLAVTQIWSSDAECLAATKGAPEAIASLCHLKHAEKEELLETVNQMASQGMRVLGIAEARIRGRELPESPGAIRFRFLGLAGLADPLRESVPEAIRQCRAAGIRVVMITGDYPQTAAAIARNAGMQAGEVLTGIQLSAMSEEELSEEIKNVNIFARIMPEQKLRLVEALKRQGDVVAMTGDGVNDAQSLKAAHVGIAMGGRGTDVAREASSIVLLDDDFGSIVRAVRLGRRIFDNIQKAMGFIFAVHVPIAGLALLPLVLDLPLLFGPVHIAFLELVIDPVCSIVFESEVEERNVMARPPRSSNAPLFTLKQVAWSIAQGALVFVLCGGVYLYSHFNGMPENEVRALTFFSLVLSVLGLILVNRSFSASLVDAVLRPNLSLRWVLVTVAVLLSATMLWPPVNHLFRFGSLHVPDLILVVATGMFVILILEAGKGLFFSGTSQR